MRQSATAASELSSNHSLVNDKKDFLSEPGSGTLSPTHGTSRSARFTKVTPRPIRSRSSGCETFSSAMRTMESMRANRLHQMSTGSVSGRSTKARQPTMQAVAINRFIPRRGTLVRCSMGSPCSWRIRSSKRSFYKWKIRVHGRSKKRLYHHSDHSNAFAMALNGA